METFILCLIYIPIVLLVETLLMFLSAIVVKIYVSIEEVEMTPLPPYLVTEETKQKIWNWSMLIGNAITLVIIAGFWNPIGLGITM